MKFHYHVFLLAVFIWSQAAPPLPLRQPHQPPLQTGKATPIRRAGFSIRYPSTWKMEVLPDQNGGLLHGVSLKGIEGGVEIYWGVGLGGACPEGFQTIKGGTGRTASLLCQKRGWDGTLGKYQ